MTGRSLRQSTHEVAKKLMTTGPLAPSRSGKPGAGSPTVARAGGVGSAPTRRNVETMVSQVVVAEATASGEPTRATTHARGPSTVTQASRFSTPPAAPNCPWTHSAGSPASLPCDCLAPIPDLQILDLFPVKLDEPDRERIGRADAINADDDAHPRAIGAEEPNPAIVAAKKHPARLRLERAPHTKQQKN